MAQQFTFTFPPKFAMRLNTAGTNKSTLAYFNVVNNETGLEFRDVRLIEGKDGRFVAAPFRTYEDKDGKTQFSDFGGPRTTRPRRRATRPAARSWRR